MIEMLFGMVREMPQDISLGRMFESFILLTIIWSRLKPHLTKIEDRMAGLELAVKTGFNSGETRFKNIEGRLALLETLKQHNIQQGIDDGKTI